MEFFDNLSAGFTAMSHWEYLAALLSVAYLLLAIRENIWCWPAAFCSTLIYTLLFWNGALLMESLLNFYYMAMAVYGWWVWRSGVRDNGRPIVSLALGYHVLIITGTLWVAIMIGFLMDNYTRADYAYLDSLTTCFAVVTTYLVAQKVLENWLYWVVIDAISIYMYIAKGYYPTVVLFVFYTVMAAWGYKTWLEQVRSPLGRTA